jgi:hypothetical protein
MTAPSDDTIAELRAEVSALRAQRDAALAKRGSDFDERAAYQAATIDVLKATSASPGDPRPVFELIVRQASALCGSTGAALYEYDGSLVHCRVAVNRSAPPEWNEAFLRQFPMPLTRIPTTAPRWPFASGASCIFATRMPSQDFPPSLGPTARDRRSRSL